MKWFSEHNCRRDSGILVLSGLMILVGLLAPANPVAGQRGNMQQQRGIQPGQVVQASPLQEAMADTLSMAEKIVTEYVLAGRPLAPSDIELINQDLDQGIRPFEKRFTGEYKSYLFLVESLMAHYQGNRTVALEKAQQAYDEVKKSPEGARSIAELIVALSLCYGDYDTAKDLLRRMGGGSAVTFQGANATTASTAGLAQTISQPEKFDPNNPRRTANPPAATGQTPVTRKPSRWLQNTGVDRTMQANANRTTMLNRQIGGGLGYVGGQPTGTGQETVETLLKLPVPYMPFENLGEDFRTLSLRGINGSYFHFEPGRGQMLFALLWTLPANSGTGQPGLGQPRQTPQFTQQRAMMGTTTDPVADTVPEVAYDLTTNADQFRQLFQMLQPYILDGKLQFVGINFDLADEYLLPEIATLTFESAWPWTTCILSEAVNQPQWQMEMVAGGPVMMLVDSQGKIRYLGPVGGFLPKMIIDAELPKARPAPSNELPNLSLAAGGPAAEEAKLAKAPPKPIIAHGTVAGREFKCEKAILRNGVLRLIQGEGIFADLEVEITLFLAEESPAHKIYAIDKQSGINIPYINLKWIPAGGVLPIMEKFTSNYEMHLEFGAISDGRMPGKINLILPNQRSVVEGEFLAEIKGP